MASMKIKRMTLVLLSLFSSCLLTAFLLLESVTASKVAISEKILASLDEKIDPDLFSLISENEPDSIYRFIVYLNDKTNLSADSLPEDAVARRIEVVQRLQTTAVTSQVTVRAQLNQLQQSGQVIDYRPFWIINAVAVTGKAQSIYDMVQRPEVSRISLDAQHELIEPINPAANDWALELLPPQSITVDYPLGWGIERIRAHYVWDGLGINGQAVTVAIMDSGVDWLHPDLIDNYRGNLGNGNFNHHGNWYHAVTPTRTVPFDPIGHGTHVAGIAIGQNSLGAAPGANWIAVAISDERGVIFNSAIHAGFEWLLAPSGDPTLAPDVVNCSWGTRYGWQTTYLEDVIALQAAGIIPVFAAGNIGPNPETINAPASFTDTLSIGASDDIDALAWFSSRGPSPLTEDVKPHLVAPGTHILSTYPGGQYAYANGTSMASPHTAGTIALLLSANPALTQADIMQILADTAVPITSTHPNDDSGWGRLDAYTAVNPHITTGIVQGHVHSNGSPMPNITITIITPSGAQLPFTTDAQGNYQATLIPGSYTLNLAPFGYLPIQVTDVAIIADETTHHDINLTPHPTGHIEGFVSETGTGQFVSATVQANNTPVTTQTDANGRYSLTLPVGQYQITAVANGHRLGQKPVTINNGQTHHFDFSLDSAPSILLIDAGQWYFNTQLNYYQDTLHAGERAYDQWVIRDPFTDLPPQSVIDNNDIVIWADPAASPGQIAANTVISNYLGSGGNLFISGKNVGRFDGTGFGVQRWWHNMLNARFEGELNTMPVPALNGLPNSPFAGLSWTLNGVGSANNQTYPDYARPHAASLTQPILEYTSGEIGGLAAGHCQPFRIVYFGFGVRGCHFIRAPYRTARTQHRLFSIPPNFYWRSMGHGRC